MILWAEMPCSLVQVHRRFGAGPRSDSFTAPETRDNILIATQPSAGECGTDGDVEIRNNHDTKATKCLKSVKAEGAPISVFMKVVHGFVIRR
jgi:hypothetical protein